jgi:hypothetical protein
VVCRKGLRIGRPAASPSQVPHASRFGPGPSPVLLSSFHNCYQAYDVLAIPLGNIYEDPPLLEERGIVNVITSRGLIRRSQRRGRQAIYSAACGAERCANS